MQELSPLQAQVPKAVLDAIRQLAQCLDHPKCWSCGCFLGAIKRLDEACPSEYRSDELHELMDRAAQVKRASKYDCKGCDVCYPALAANALNEGPPDVRFDLGSCAETATAVRNGWPPLPGEYEVSAYQAPVAVCVLNSTNLASEISVHGSPFISIVGPLRTENLGIERLISNIVANPFIRFLILCGADSRGSVGHLPGQSFVALAENGVDEAMHIRGARGKRPVLRNISSEAVTHFLQTVEVIDRIGVEDVPTILQRAEQCSNENPGPAEPFDPEPRVKVMNGYVPASMTLDPSGYFVIHVDRAQHRIFLEHYQTDGVIDFIVQGGTASEVWTPVIDNGLISRLDHAAYLGRELAHAEHALETGQPFVQDAAPESRTHTAAKNCGCESCH